MIKGVRKITVFAPNENGGIDVVAKYGKGKGKGKGRRRRSRMLKVPERNMRKVNEAARAFIDELDTRHERSTRKKKDGWLRDSPKNVMKANRKALKKLQKMRIF
ncbi:MAG: hypothetical protein CL927_15350 [Deltaproteobacteria bacterium]|nr:hypothetical protein [Deltaproteobacteria bacterium]HCH65715.1 hypothetical protein [Deltaproteobacteria bacterium]